MRIVIDVQARQSKSRFRGIGRYTDALIRNLASLAQHHEIWLTLNNQFPEAVVDVRRQFSGLIPQERIVVFSVPSQVAEQYSQNIWRARAAERLREHFLAQLQPDIVHVSSLFEGWEDDVVTSVGVLESALFTSVTLYDLIPFVRQDLYLSSEAQQKYYFRKINSLKNANLCLSISEHSRQEAMVALGIPEDKIINISCAADDHFVPLTLAKNDRQRIFHRYGIRQPFVLNVPGGFDARKNIEGLIKAYSKLSTQRRREYQLVVASKLPDEITRQHFVQYAQAHGLGAEQFVLTGYVPDTDLVALYNLCDLFIFPSLYEGFGLPALEAMSCGAAVIGSKTSSIPEVIGRSDALFDPNQIEAITQALEKALSNADFRQSLRKTALQQAAKFSWQETAQRTLSAFEAAYEEIAAAHTIQVQVPSPKPRLAFISPLPPERSGIADYSVELLQELVRFYDITLVANQSKVEYDWLIQNFPIKDVVWFEDNHHRFDRVLYQFGNSHFHQHMFRLLEKYPGTVVLHDFYLSNLLYWLDATGVMPGQFFQEVYASHGYQALKTASQKPGDEATWLFPCNKTVIDQAEGIIVHSQYALTAASTWYGPDITRNWSLIPQIYVPPKLVDREQARAELGFQEDDFLICSFGLVGPIKLNQRLLDAWLNSELGSNPRCHLIFVGDNHRGDYGKQLTDTILQAGVENRVRITGFVDAESYGRYLAAADTAVQLRTLSRGETSRSVLEVMAYGLPLLLNAHGTMAEYPNDVVYKLPDQFTDAALTEALERLYQDKTLRHQLAKAGQTYVNTHHHPKLIGEKFYSAVEYYAKTGPRQRYQHLLKGLASVRSSLNPTEADLESTARSIAANIPQPGLKKLFLDISVLVNTDLKTGIERVTRSILMELLNTPPSGFRVEPIYYDGTRFRYARRFILNRLGLPDYGLTDTVVEVQSQDTYLSLEWNAMLLIEAGHLLKQWQARGVKVFFIIFDLLPILKPNCFPPGTYAYYERWLRGIAKVSNGLIGISRSTVSDAFNWLSQHQPEDLQHLRLGYFHLGADIQNSIPTMGLPADAKTVLAKLQKDPSFLMVGTVEPRKGHAQVLAAFELLWQQDLDVNLVIVGKHGWMVDMLAERMLNHPLAGKRLFWLRGISDEYLEAIYAASTALISASEGEGFGLPLIEAAQHGLPIIARNLPVFEEVAGDHAFYFEGEAPGDLADAITTWLDLRSQGAAPESTQMPWQKWSQSAQQLMQFIAGDLASGQILFEPGQLDQISSGLDSESRPLVRQRQLLVDVSELVQQDARSGIQRVVRSIVFQLLQTSLPEHKVELVYFDGQQHRYARQFTQQILGVTASPEADSVIVVNADDVFLALDLTPNLSPPLQAAFTALRQMGVQIYFVVYDLLLLHHPEWWPAGTAQVFTQWMKTVTSMADGVVCISEAVAAEVAAWVDKHAAERTQPLSIRSFHLGADLKNSLPTTGMPEDAPAVLEQLKSNPTFLMVGTLEPRKGHAQTLSAFEQLWQQGIAANLVIVGKQGWLVDDLIERLTHHPQLNQQLFWLQGISDEYLEAVYAASTALIAASEGEGFGLPLIEAAQHGLPIIARNLPVFREVAGDHAFYFEGTRPRQLAKAIQSWLGLQAQGQVPSSAEIPWLTWEESTQQLLAAILEP